MISNVTLRLSDPGMAMILGLVGALNGRGAGPTPSCLEPGLFMSTHWNFDAYLPRGEWSLWWDGPEGFPPCHGVCDSPEQFKSKYLEALRDDQQAAYVTSFVRVRRADEPSEGGWRWHKWGKYVGNMSPQHEYLHDEVVIEEVYTFHVYRRATPSESTKGDR